MLRWCAYCQEFQGEVAPLNIFTTTHGICDPCLSNGMRQLDTEIDNAHRLRIIQGLLYEAGKTGDADSASAIVHFSMQSGLRPVDILVGLVTPLLYRIGVEWQNGQITIPDQERFSVFCEQIYELVKIEVESTPATNSAYRHALVFLFNVPGNEHSLGIRILSLWLQSKGIQTREFHTPPSAQELMELVAESTPSAILISLALKTQLTNLYDIAQRIEGLPNPRPVLIVGGYAVKHRLIRPIAGTLFVETITGLDDLIWNLK
jgi:methanogenic corrinoid protein MtbC1